MGDPGLPIMAGVLAVPVGVLLLVLVLALMGRRWVLTGPDTALAADYDAVYEYGRLGPAPYRPALEPPRHASSTAYDAYAPQTYATPPRNTYASEAYASPPRDAYGSEAYAPPPRDNYGVPVREPYAPPRTSEVSDWEPYVPTPRRALEAPSPSPYGAPADAYGAAPGDPYAASARDPYGPSGRFPYAPPAAQNEYPDAARTYDRPESSASPDPWHLAPEDRQRFPHGPYGSH
ncbi:MAG: hypothetical protein ACJ72W_13245 [Actinoallomurus sp.]